MEKDWVKVHSAFQQHKVVLAKVILEEHGIESVIMDKRDSAITSIGEIELYTNREDILKAINILNKNTL